ncbi:hypothetical protein [Actinoplanes sp. NPDC089786]|uniref:hypothetical protein n=1 Tax=Actinoplanes sp. NPDC089786 TaxID=3155185 RepID=UPI003428BD2F
MSHEDDHPAIIQGTPLSERVEATEQFAEIAERLLRVGDLKWSEVEADYRTLAFNDALRRQLESINSAVLLCRNGLGHLSVAFVRASLEDVMYLGFFCELELAESQELFLTLGKWDAIRSLLAQRSYVGDEVTAKLWYPIPSWTLPRLSASRSRNI